MLTPNALSKAGGQQPVVFRVDLEHMQYFTTSSLHRLARDAGLLPLHLETYGFPSIGETAATLGSRIKSLVRALPLINSVRKIRDASAYRTCDLGTITYWAFFRRNRPEIFGSEAFWVFLEADSFKSCNHMRFSLVA